MSGSFISNLVITKAAKITKRAHNIIHSFIQVLTIRRHMNFSVLLSQFQFISAMIMYLHLTQHKLFQLCSPTCTGTLWLQVVKYAKYILVDIWCMHIVLHTLQTFLWHQFTTSTQIRLQHHLLTCRHKLFHCRFRICIDYTRIGVGTRRGGAIATPIFQKGEQSPLDLQPSIVIIQTF